MVGHILVGRFGKHNHVACCNQQLNRHLPFAEDNLLLRDLLSWAEGGLIHPLPGGSERTIIATVNYWPY